MLLHGAVPHQIDFLLAYLLIVVKELKKKEAFLDHLRMDRLTKQHVKYLIAVHPLNQEAFR